MDTLLVTYNICTGIYAILRSGIRKRSSPTAAAVQFHEIGIAGQGRQDFVLSLKRRRQQMLRDFVPQLQVHPSVVCTTQHVRLVSHCFGWAAILVVSRGAASLAARSHALPRSRAGLFCRRCNRGVSKPLRLAHTPFWSLTLCPHGLHRDALLLLLDGRYKVAE